MGKDLAPTSTCPTCNKSFAVGRNKKFCCLKCYVASDLFKQIMAERRTGETVTCQQCGKSIYRTKASAKKYCDKACYRRWKAARFDRYIASEFRLSGISNFDEFLSSGSLKCPVEGCGWEGDHLSMHMNYEHGIKADEFKMMAGFNLTTGVITNKLRTRLQETSTSAQTIQYARDARGQADTSKQRGYRSKESEESRTKEVALREKRQVMLKCAHCGKDFAGDSQQASRAKRGKNVCCSTVCRQTFVSHQRTGKT